MKHIEHDYLNLLKDILENGVEKKDRTGTGTISVFGRQIRHKMSEGFPLLTTKKMYWKGIVTELLWFLRGSTNIKYLVDNDCHIWDGDAYKSYLAHYVDEYNEELEKKNEGLGWMAQELVNIRPLSKEQFIEKIRTDNEFANKWGYLGPVYGKQWRRWSPMGRGQEMNGMFTIEENMKMNSIDQIQNLINDLKINPDSRRIMVNAWNVGELDQMVLPPCHYGFQVYTRELSHQERLDIACKGDENGIMPVVPMYEEKEKMVEVMNEKNIPTRGISLMWNQRSVDTPLGLPFNIASYALLLLMLAKQVNMAPDELIGNLGDTHIYLNQVDGIKEQLTRKPHHLPNVHISDVKVNDISDYTLDDISLINYKAHPKIKLPLSN